MEFQEDYFRKFDKPVPEVTASRMSSIPQNSSISEIADLVKKLRTLRKWGWDLWCHWNNLGLKKKNGQM